MKKLISFILCVSMLVSLAVPAMAIDEIHTEADPDTYVEEIVDGNLFVTKTDNKMIAIVTNDVKHLIHISIKDLSDPDVVYQWIIDDYPINDFSSTDSSFFDDMIEYAEENIDDATLVEFSLREVSENEPMPASAVENDLANDMEALVGKEHSNQYVTDRIKGGNVYSLYETMEFAFRKTHVISWRDSITITSLIVTILGLAVTTGIASTICSILGIATGALDTIIPAGKLDKYNCMALYTRYIKVDGGKTEYAHAFKTIAFEGYDDASSREEAHVLADTITTYYDMNQSEDYFNNGIFDEAYKDYNNIW